MSRVIAYEKKEQLEDALEGKIAKIISKKY